MDSAEHDESFCLSHLEDDLHSLLSSSIFVEDVTFANLFQKLDVYADNLGGENESGKPLVVVADSGVGKSAALANWTARRARCVPPTRRLDYTEFVFWHAIGCSRLSTQVTHLLRRLVNELIVHFELKGAMDLADEKLPWILPRLLERASKRGRVIIVIDGLHQICSNDKDYGLKWLPLSLPTNVRMILSATTPHADPGNGEETTDHTKRLRTKVQQTWNEIQRRNWPTVLVECLQDASCVANFIQNYLAQFPEQEILLSQRNQLINTISTHPLATNLMFLTSVLQGICHADSLGYNVNQCLASWMPCQSATELMKHMLSLFESRMPRRSSLSANKSNHLGSMLGDSLSLLFVARHGLHENELFELLGRINQQSDWNSQTEGTVVPVKLKLLQILMHKKNRLIDIFRSFDTDGNGTLSHEEFYDGMERLEINVSHEEVTLLINEVDNNGDGEIDYQETLDHFEQLARSYSHGKRRVSIFGKNVPVKEDFSDYFKNNLISTLRCVGVSCLDVGNGTVLTLPFANTALRDTIWSRYVDTSIGNNEGKSRSFIIEFYAKKEPSLRYCEEFPWHLKKGCGWLELKKIIVDLRTLDIMFGSSELKTELFDYLRILSIGGKIKFDIVREYNQSMQRWCQNSNPPSNQISRMSHFIADVMAWFSKSISRLTRLPPFMRESLDHDYLHSIGIDLSLDRERSESAGPRMLQNRRADQMQSEAQYFFNRWVWIQFPWLALKNASMTRQKNLRQPNDESSDVPSKTTPSTPEHRISLRDKSKITARISEPSPTMKKLDKMESSEPRRKNPTVIPFSLGTSWESKKDLGDRNSNDESSYENAAKQLRELKHMYDTLNVEADSKEKHFNELQSASRSRQVDDAKSHRRIVKGEKSLREFQSRLEKINGLMEMASNVDSVYQDVLLALHHQDPSNQYAHIQLEQQIVLCKQQIADLQQEGSAFTKEIEKIEARSNKVSLDAKSIVQERQMLKPQLEKLRTRLEEESERRKNARVATFDATSFSRRVRLEGRIAKRRENKLKNRRQSMYASNVAEIDEAAKLHPMERLAQVSGTRSPTSIVEILKEDETRRLRARQEKGELQIKEQVATLESLENQIKELSFADSAIETRSAATIDNDVANAEVVLSNQQKRLDSISQLVQDVSLAILNLTDTVQSAEEDHALNEFVRFTMQAAAHAKLDKEIKLITSLRKEIASEIELYAKKKEYNKRGQTKYNNVRILNRAEQEARLAKATKQVQDVDDEDSNDSEHDTNEDFGKLASYVNQGIQTNASQNQQRRANLLSHAKQGKYASKGIILELCLSASKEAANGETS